MFNIENFFKTNFEFQSQFTQFQEYSKETINKIDEKKIIDNLIKHNKVDDLESLFL